MNICLWTLLFAIVHKFKDKTCSSNIICRMIVISKCVCINFSSYLYHCIAGLYHCMFYQLHLVMPLYALVKNKYSISIRPNIYIHNFFYMTTLYEYMGGSRKCFNWKGGGPKDTSNCVCRGRGVRGITFFVIILLFKFKQ